MDFLKKIIEFLSWQQSMNAFKLNVMKGDLYWYLCLFVCVCEHVKFYQMYYETIDRSK